MVLQASVLEEDEEEEEDEEDGGQEEEEDVGTSKRYNEDSSERGGETCVNPIPLTS